MNMTKKIIIMALGTAWASSAFALLPAGATPTSPPPGAPVGSVISMPSVPTNDVVATPSVEVAPPSDGNSYEKLVTPLLRQISQRKAQLELKKLDRAIERLDQDSIKDQIDLKAEQDKANAPKTLPTNNAGFTPTYAPNAIPNMNPPNSLVGLNSLSSGVRVLMTYGYSDHLFAKIASGDQGGYVVSKGDVLPDGREVIDVQPNFIAVKKDREKAKSGVERIFVTGEPLPVVKVSNGLPGSINSNPQNPNLNDAITQMATPLGGGGRTSSIIPTSR